MPDDLRMTGFSAAWKDLFLRTRPQTQTDQNVAFLRQVIPMPEYAKVLDACCGLGRHAAGLREHGYKVTGIDIDADLVAEATELHPGVSFMTMDMRDLDDLSGMFDAVICVWQSFGYFDEETNASVLRSMVQRLRPGGRIVFDLYNREWFELPEHREIRSETGGVSTKSRYVDPRLTVDLSYPDGTTERFDWQLYSPSEFQALGAGFGLRPVLSCANWDAASPPSSETREFQIVLEKV